MVGIVRLALLRPYTFVVMALLIMIFGVMAALRTPTDIFPDIKIPVIAAVWTYTGLPPDEMSGRVVSVYEKSLTTTVNDIEHIESQSLAGYGIVKIFFQPNVNINTANAQVTAISQTVLKQMPAGITPPIILNFSASSVPILQVALSSRSLSEQQLADTALNVIRPPLVTVPGAALPYPYGGKSRQMQIDLDQKALRSYGLAAQDVVTALTLQNLITPVGSQKIGKFEYTVNLNDAPKRLAEFRDLPIKTVNGTVIFMRDVANVHDAAPPQTNVVTLDGQKGVLMSVLKTGSASTLEIIAGIKAALPSIEQILPPGLDVKLVGDQSAFVQEAISGVVKEGIIAAALTGLMILIFLGSWRSTLIITVSIPLAILASVTILSLLGETINVMTLGGLALAVGILVDDATVTIENVNWHLEQGKPIETAILDGAQQIVVPATVSLLCICIAFVPMFGLGGVAGYLFRPLAEAVIFAMIASFILSRTLVPTMANYLLRNPTHGAHGEMRQTRNPFVRFQQAFERRFERVRLGYAGILQMGLRNRGRLIIGFLVITTASFGLVPLLGSNFFPDLDSGEIKLHVRGQTGLRIESMTALCNRIESVIRDAVPVDEMRSVVANIGLPISGINTAYSNSGAIGPEDADLLISLEDHHQPTAAYVRALRQQLPEQFPGVTFSFLPADIVSQILNFGAPAPIDLQIIGPNYDANREFATNLLGKLRGVAGLADVRIQQAFAQPTLNVAFDRTLASLVGLNTQNAATSMLQTLAGSSQTNPIYWLNPENQVSYPVSIQTPQYAMDKMTDLQNLPLAAGSASQLLGGLAGVTASATHCRQQPLQYPAGDRHLRHAGRSRSWRRGYRCAQSDGGDGRQAAARVTHGAARASCDDDVGLSTAVHRHRLRYCTYLPAHRRELPVVARPGRHRVGAADRACRHRVDAVCDSHDPVRAGADGCNHVHGRRDGKLDPHHKFCARASGRGRRRDTSGARCRRVALSSRPDDRACHGDRHGAYGDRAGTECAARARRHRRPDLCDLRHAAFRACAVRRRS